MPTRDLIFDVGMFDGADTAFYLAKGFCVVAVEARPDLCARARERFPDELKRGTLTIVERAVWRRSDERIAFHVRSGWSSVYRDSAERDGQPSTCIEVETTTVSPLFAQFGVPHYLKCDIEGAENIVVDALGEAPVRPTFFSFEDPTGAIAKRVAAVGYDRFQMVNQGHLRLYRPPRPAREGAFCDVQFDGKSSGLFGYELESGHWDDVEILQERMRFWQALRAGRVNPVLALCCKRWGKITKRGWLIASGWADIHATTAAALHR